MAALIPSKIDIRQKPPEKHRANCSAASAAPMFTARLERRRRRHRRRRSRPRPRRRSRRRRDEISNEIRTNGRTNSRSLAEEIPSGEASRGSSETSSLRITT